MNVISIYPPLEFHLQATLEGRLLKAMAGSLYHTGSDQLIADNEDASGPLEITEELLALLAAADDECAIKKAITRAVTDRDADNFCEVTQDLEIEYVLQCLLRKIDDPLAHFKVVGVYNEGGQTGAWFSFVTAYGWINSNIDAWMEQQKLAMLSKAVELSGELKR